ncbi:hypothetical protein HNQ91_005976 [Filimonas zeae]|uniref:DUF3592 domain-containing protein n=1 Tax=Filimonas zeae TaxID=1737353 RepID=A0A917J4R2_9BACT|nr:DUF3592 domain-containing protein [Filimonas zeae]MDR6342889.1 hypothetical protein [Filimonas zeae]GGH83108.1 hypothetical protein GCM10011379_58000 [Filimonas zeae]
MNYGLTLLIGIVLIVISSFLIKEQLDFLKTTERAIGKVIELQEVPKADDDGIAYRPIFRYTAKDKQEYIYRHNASYSPSAWDIGEKAIIAYQSDKPYKGTLVTYFETFSWSIIMMIIGSVLIVIGGGYFLSKLVIR